MKFFVLFVSLFLCRLAKAVEVPEGVGSTGKVYYATVITVGHDDVGSSDVITVNYEEKEMAPYSTIPLVPHGTFAPKDCITVKIVEGKTTLVEYCYMILKILEGKQSEVLGDKFLSFRKIQHLQVNKYEEEEGDRVISKSVTTSPTG